MRPRYILAPEAARNLIAIWRHISKEASRETADRIEAMIRRKIVYLTQTSAGGHWRRDLTSDSVRFLAVYSYLIVYRPDTTPLQIVAILHGKQDVKYILSHHP